MYNSNVQTNQAKRQLSYDMSWEVEPKKLRTSDENNIFNTRMEHLSNELFYEIFDYLDSSEMFNAFSNLNTRFECLLIDTSLPLKIYRSTSSDQFYEHYCQRLIIPNKHRILSLHIWDRSQIITFFTLHSIDSSFYRLESLMLNGINFNELISFLPSLKTLPRLFSLNIHLHNTLNDYNAMYRLIFQLPMLKYNKLSADRTALKDPLPISTHNQCSSIEQLVIDHPCTLAGINHILSFTPRLHRLTCNSLHKLNQTIHPEIPIRMFNLTHCSMTTCFFKFDEFEIFTKTICSQLRVLHFAPCSDIVYLDADRWERLISKHMPYLHTFHFKYSDDIYGHFEFQPYHRFINRFSSLFWTERRWFFDIQIDVNQWPPFEIIYSIRPYKKQWYEVFDYKTNEIRFTRIPSSVLGSQLTVRSCHFVQCDQWFIDFIRFISALTQINYLHIEFYQFSMDVIIKFLQQLPNLDSLTVKSMFSNQENEQHKEQIDIAACSVSNINKITKVNIENMGGLNEIDILMDLCPRMEYLRVQCRSHIDLELIICLILTKRRMNFIPYLHSICLGISGANDEMLNRLQTIINFEKLLVNYTIKRSYDRIYLQW